MLAKCTFGLSIRLKKMESITEGFVLTQSSIMVSKLHLRLFMNLKDQKNLPSKFRNLETKIYFIRNHNVILDEDLAALYRVKLKALNQAVRRNLERFPVDFMLQLTPDEYEVLRSQIVTLKTRRGQHRKYLPYAFTEQGIAMLSGVLKSESAVLVNIAIMRAFVNLRRLLIDNKELARKLHYLENKYVGHDEKFKVVFDAIKKLMSVGSPLMPKRIKPLDEQ